MTTTGSQHTLEIIIKALTVLAYKAGNVSGTCKQLKEEGITVSATALTNWRDNEYAEDYKRIRQNFASKFEDEIALDMREIAGMGIAVQRRAIERADEELGRQTTAKDASQTALNMSRLVKDNVEKLLVLTGRPSEITDDRSARSAYNALVAKGILKKPSRVPDEGQENGEE